MAYLINVRKALINMLLFLQRIALRLLGTRAEEIQRQVRRGRGRGRGEEGGRKVSKLGAEEVADVWNGDTSREGKRLYFVVRLVVAKVFHQFRVSVAEVVEAAAAERERVICSAFVDHRGDLARIILSVVRESRTSRVDRARLFVRRLSVDFLPADVVVVAESPVVVAAAVTVVIFAVVRRTSRLRRHR